MVYEQIEINDKELKELFDKITHYEEVLDYDNLLKCCLSIIEKDNFESKISNDALKKLYQNKYKLKKEDYEIVIKYYLSEVLKKQILIVCII